MPRSNDLKLLHPAFRKKVKQLLKRLDEEKIPFRLFEGYRHPERQRYLYAKGRTTNGPIVTRAKPWQSYHQYDITGDFVLYINKRWSWENRDKYGQYWERLHELAHEFSLKAFSWEKPHLQLTDITLEQLLGGSYPDGADDDWAQNFAAAIECWTGF